MDEITITLSLAEWQVIASLVNAGLLRDNAVALQLGAQLNKASQPVKPNGEAPKPPLKDDKSGKQPQQR